MQKLRDIILIFIRSNLVLPGLLSFTITYCNFFPFVSSTLSKSSAYDVWEHYMLAEAWAISGVVWREEKRAKFRFWSSSLVSQKLLVFLVSWAVFRCLVGFIITLLVSFGEVWISKRNCQAIGVKSPRSCSLLNDKEKSHLCGTK